MNPIISAEINKYKALLNGLRAGEDSHARSFAEGCVFGMETIANLAGSWQGSVAPARPLPPRPTTVKEALAPNSERLPDSGLFDKENNGVTNYNAEPTPKIFPQTAELAGRRAQAQGIEASFAASYWIECQARNWFNRRGKKIKDWDKHLAGMWKDEQQQRISAQNG